VRQRFIAALRESLPDGPPPDPEKYLDRVAEPERSVLRSELAALAKAYLPPPGTGGMSAAATVPGNPDATAEAQGPAVGKVDVVPVQEAGPGDMTVSPQQTASSLPHPGTADHAPADSEITVDHPTIPYPKAGVAAGPPPEWIGRYAILGTLGRGAMGVVYKARQQGLNRLVALKMILAGDHASEHELARFRSEAEAVAQIQHPNIVQVYEVGNEAGWPYISLEYLEGGSLARKINGTPQPPAQAAEVTRLLAQAMACAHQQGIIHRDLKSANILLTPDGSPKITDFGLAKKVEEDSGHTRTGTIMGSPSYMAPEQAEGRIHDVGHLADVYSLGAILYELLTGRPPFRGTSVLETLQQVRTQEPVAPTQLQPGVPADLETICLKCLQKEPGKRYAGAAALAADLGRFLAGEPIQARSVGRVERLGSWCKRNPRVAVLSGTVAGLVVVWAVTSSVLAWQLKQQKDEANFQARIAQENTSLAREKEREAQEMEARAKKNAEAAKRRFEKTADAMVAVVEQSQNRLRSRRLVARNSPEIRQLREDLFAQFRQALVNMAQEMKRSEGTQFGVAGVCQRLGDVLFKLGQREEALQQYQLGYDLVKQVAEQRPEDDVARGNLGVMLLRMGDVALEGNGDGRAARTWFAKARDVHQDVADHPRNGYYKEVDTKRLLSHDELRLGKAELYLGDPAAARKHFQKAFALRTAWSEAEPEKAEPSSYVMEARMWLGVANSHLGDTEALRDHFDQAVQIGEALVRKHPKFLDFKGDLAAVHGAYGDAQLRIGLLDAARQSYRQTLENLQVVVARNPDDVSRDPLVALTYEHLAVLHLRQGQRPEAEKYYRQALQVREDLLQLERNNRDWQAAYLLALAHCGKHAEAARGAEGLRQNVARSTELLLQLARCYAVCAGAAADPAQKQRHTEKALEAMAAATQEGYKDLVILRSDPDIGLLQQELAYQALLTRLGKSAR